MKNIFSATLWSVIDKLLIAILQILIEVVLARLLLPSDYGLIGIIIVFTSFIQLFSDGGFTNALIFKQDRTEVDFSTIFYFNIFVSVFFYLILFFLAPYIAVYFDNDILIILIRIIGISVILNSLSFIHKTKLNIDLNFKLQTKISIISLLISGCVAIIVAIYGFGVWALVVQNILFCAINLMLFGLYIRWKPLLIFSVRSFKELFNYGSKLLGASIIQSLYQNSYSFVIAKIYNQSSLGLFSKANQFTLMPVGMITNSLQRVVFSFLSKYQDDDEKLYKFYLRYINIVAMLFFIVFATVATLADPIIRLILGDNWLSMIELFRVLCVAYVFYPLININMIYFQIKNRTDLFLKTEIYVKIFAIVIFVSTIRFGLFAICCGILFQHVIQFVITTILVSKLFGKKSFLVFRFVGCVFFILAILSLSILVALQGVKGLYGQFFLGFVLFVAVYSLFLYCIKDKISFFIHLIKF
jgi:teichuronic acid exporter